MGLRYQVDSQLPHPVYIQTDKIIEIIPIAEYMASLPILEGFDSDSPAAASVYCSPEFRPVGNSAFHPNFVEWYTAARLDNGEVVTIRKEEGHELTVGDYVWYDITFDDLVLFKIDSFPRKLTLVEKTDGSASTNE